MPFVQRVVQPVNLAQVAAASASVSATTPTTAATTASGIQKFQCVPGRCKNNNCLNKLQQQQQPPLDREQRQRERESHESEAALAQGGNGNGITERESVQQQQQQRVNGALDVSVKDTPTKQKSLQQQREQHEREQEQTTTVTKAIVHTPQLNGRANDVTDHIVSLHTPKHLNGFGSEIVGGGITVTPSSFSYATDTEEEVVLLSLPSPGSPVPATLSMKKLKQHVEFLSTAPSPSRTADASSMVSRGTSGQQRRPGMGGSSAASPQSPTAARIVAGYEFDSISNITLSNALRQLASLVLIASEIFDELQQELQSVNERTRAVHRKMVAVERRVCAYDPKMVTVPESDLLTFAQRKTHYETDKSFRKELFTAETRPRSVRTLYEDAGKVAPPASAAATRSTSPHCSPFGNVINGIDGLLDYSDTGAATTSGAGGNDELVCTPVFGKANRKMRTRIDAEIEIRLPAAIEDLRKWTSTEALGDVTVTPDCMHHVDTSISTSVIIGDNGVLTPALSPSVLSADAVDALYSINISNAHDNTQSIPNDVNKDVPLNHRLPSPEEQCKIIALRYPAEVISVDTSGKRFERMCMARKSTTGCFTNISDANNLNDDVQTVSRRSRSRKVRGKRRNTIAGIDQKEIQDAANGDSTGTSSEIKNVLDNVAATSVVVANAANDEDGRRVEKSKKFGRSKSSDILKKESVALPYDKGKSTLARLNSLKQWGRNRFKFMQSKETTTPTGGPSSIVGQNPDGHSSNTGSGSGSGNGVQHTSGERPEAGAVAKTSQTSKSTGIVGDIDDVCVVHELVTQKSEGRFSHERKPSYSSSEKSMSVSSSGHLKGKLHLATCGNVKLRDTSSLNRQRRSGISAATGLGGKEEQPHSSSGNWSASSESGRASIGSEITIQPKSSASNTSLNVSSFHPGSGPPSSMLSRRRFLNTSASSSVTSEGTTTPDLQVADGAYPNHLDDETSSAYSCDTEGYYTSFHMDSGLRTLKEEDPPMTPLQQSGQHLHTSNYSFGSQSNQTVLSAENEYELFGRGSTSTTTSSAGTVCTTLLVNGEQSSLNSLGPDVPERISSLGKLNKSNHSNSASTSTLERSYSSSTIGSTLERTGTIKRNVNASLKLVTAQLDDLEYDEKTVSTAETPESQDDEFNFQQKLHRRGAQPLPPGVLAEIDCSESSDLEGVERIERIKQKTAMTAKRIPSMCIITPTTSDDENQTKDTDSLSAYDPDRTLTEETDSERVELDVDEASGYCTVTDSTRTTGTPTKQLIRKPGDKDHNFNVFDKLKVLLPSVKRTTDKSSPSPVASAATASVVNNDELYDMAGEYVTIADISNNNRHNQLPVPPSAMGASSLGIYYYSNDIVRRKQSAEARTKQGNEPANDGKKTYESDDATTTATTTPTTTTPVRRETEYVSLNELPADLRKIGTVSGVGRGGAYNATALSPATPGRSVRHIECAESRLQQRESTAAVPMYAEISELREEKTCSSSSPTTTITAAATTIKAAMKQPTTVEHKGARVRVNAQGKIIYDSDSLKRRKGAHTTFAPGPYVKETESALAEINSTNSESVTSTIVTTTTPTATTTTTIQTATQVPKINAAAKLLLLNGGIASTRKTANVRPILTKTQQQQHQQQQQLSNTISEMPTTYNSSLGHGDDIGGIGDEYQQHQHQQQQQAANAYYQYNAHKQLLVNHTNPFYTANNNHAVNNCMLPSPSAKSNSSTGSTNSSSNGGSSSTTTTSSSKEEGFQRFYRDGEQPQSQPAEQTITPASPFQRNTPIYWTLQNRRQTKPPASNVTCRDDLYATPIRRSERVARAAAAANANSTAGSNISPIVPRNTAGFHTSTPTRTDGTTTTGVRSGAQWDDNSPERFNTCSDRIGHSKTSLMDFKKLLLAKSSKTSPVQKKVSAVELLKKSNPGTASNGTQSTTNAMPILNSSMKLLDLSGSPKTFANRRMLRQGQFGSPSKAFAPKLKTTNNAVVGTWRHNDIMSTTIPEANSEEDHSNNSGSSKASSEAGDVSSLKEREQARELTSQQRYDLKRNFFLQTEENNFMRGELKPSFNKNAHNALGSPTGNKYVSGPVGSIAPNSSILRPASMSPGASVNVSAVTASMPALETAL